MSLESLLAAGQLREHRTSAQEIEDLLQVANRDLSDARVRQISTDRRFITSYNAVLALGTIALHAAGYRAVGPGHHRTTFMALPEIMGPRAQSRADYFDQCRSKRNISDYDRSGEISEAEVDEIMEETISFRDDLIKWLRVNHPKLLPL